MKKIHFEKLFIPILIIGILCTCLFGCTDKPASGNDVTSTTESTTKGEESTTLGDESGNEEDSSVHKEKSPVKKDDETTIKKKTNVKESSTKKVDKETTTKGTTTTESTTEAYTPTPLVPLTAEQELKIKEDFLDFNFERLLAKGENLDNYPITNKDISIEEYFGTYQECVVMIMGNPFGGYFTTVTVNEIGGYKFSYPVRKATAVYRNGEFVTLEQAYERGWLSYSNLRDIYHYHTTQYFNFEHVEDYPIFEEPDGYAVF